MKWLTFPFIALISAVSNYGSAPAKGRKRKFWKFAKDHPEVAYYFFKGEDCFMVFDYKPQNGYRPNLSSGEWDGPFRLHMPSRGCTLNIYGQSPYYQIALENFMDRFHV